ncbi:Protein OSB1 [Abeliophyllum distichum]|uniref:Protein OSB1 n=1 Tax=Abeliophyllum distichum TaxID=126358 RepID=A0ABD1VTN3_9LAMI
MALQQTVILTRKPFLCTYQNPLPISQSFRSVSITTKSNRSKRLGSVSRIKCSFDYNNTAASNSNGVYEYERFAGSQYPRPSEIQWKKELCNSVQLIGIVATPVQIKLLPSGKVLAWSRLAVKKSQNDTIWINLTFWDEMAHIASEHVEKGHQIYISGRLVSDTVKNEDETQQTYYKVVVQQLNFVERGLSSVSLYNGDSNSPTPGRKQNNYATNTMGSTEELWQAFFANPLEWWDNRKNKRSPNYPDFKHKDTGEALWVESRYNPPWVKSQLAILDSKMVSIHDQSSSMHVNFMSADSLGPF